MNLVIFAEKPVAVLTGSSARPKFLRFVISCVKFVINIVMYGYLKVSMCTFVISLLACDCLFCHQRQQHCWSYFLL